MDAYSLDLRQRIVRACNEALDSRPEIAHSFSVSLSFVNKLWRRWSETGSAAVRPKGKGPPPMLNSATLEQLRQCVEHKPDATLSELCNALAKAGGPAVSRSTMCRALRTLGLPLKKSLCMPVNATRRA
jgi:transposase